MGTATAGVFGPKAHSYNKIIIKINSKSPWWIKAYVKIDHGFVRKLVSREK